MTRVRALHPGPSSAEYTFEVGAPVKDGKGNVIGTVVGVRSHPDGIEIEFELEDVGLLRNSGPFTIEEDNKPC